MGGRGGERARNLSPLSLSLSLSRLSLSPLSLSRYREANGGVTSDAEGVTSPPSDVTVFSSDVIEDVTADARRGVVVTVTCAGVPRS